MTPRARRTTPIRAVALGLALACAVGLAATPAPAQQTGTIFPIPVPGQGRRDPNHDGARPEARQVSLCGVIATPGGTIDPRLASIQPQLSRLLPGYGFRLLGVDTRRLTAGQSLSVPLGDGMVAGTTLVEPTDPEGKVHLRVNVTQNQATLMDSKVHTPVNQLFYLDRVHADGSRLLICIGAR